MHGIGNDFVLLAPSVSDALPAEVKPVLARAMCDRRFGIGADGLIFVESTPEADCRMRMLNPDGSSSEMCGNGLRCVALFLGRQPGEVAIETGGRITVAERLEGGLVRVNMGYACITALDMGVQGYRGVAVDVGNPHFVAFVPDVDAIEMERIGPVMEHDPGFPHRSNIHFATQIDARTLQQRTWERGAGITLACGSGACAVAAASVALGLTGTDVEVRLPGGSLRIEITEDGTAWMTGPAVESFSGTWRAE